MKMSVRWNTYQVTNFLEIYKKYPLLYDINHKDYSNKNKKSEQFLQLIQEVNENGLHVTENELKKKIKSYKDCFRAELQKVRRSTSTGVSTTNLYVPKLAWFNDALFLKNCVSTRGSSSNPVQIITLTEENGDDDELPVLADDKKLDLINRDAEDIESDDIPNSDESSSTSMRNSWATANVETRLNYKHKKQLSKSAKMPVRWDTFQIMNFLEIYKRYPVLYDTKHKDYSNKNEKNVQFLKLVQEVNRNGLHIKEEELKRKIKNYRDCFRVEMQKMQRSSSKDNTTTDLYVPKLAWFKAALFLKDCVKSRTWSSNSEIQMNDDDAHRTPNVVNGDVKDIDSDTTGLSENISKRNKRKTAFPLEEYDKAFKQISFIKKELAHKDANDCFGEYIAKEIKKLAPLDQAILKKNIQTVVSDFIIEKLSAANTNVQLILENS